MLTRTTRKDNTSDKNASDDRISGIHDFTGSTKKFIIEVPVFVRRCLQIVLMIVILTASYMVMKKLVGSSSRAIRPTGFQTIYTVETIPVTLVDQHPDFTVYGKAVASREVDLRSLVAGETIWVNSKLKAGMLVNKGDALVRIDLFNFEGALREAEANLDEARARVKENKSLVNLEKIRLLHLNEQLELARSDRKRIASLYVKGATTQKQLDERIITLSQRTRAVEQSQNALQTAKARLEQKNANLKRLEWHVQQAERNLLNTTLKAPFDSVVRSVDVAVDVDVGKVVRANDVVVSLYENAKMDIRFTLNNKRYGSLQTDGVGIVNRKVTVIWAIGGREYSYPAIINRIGAAISSSHGGVEVFATLQNVRKNPVIRPGAFVKISVPDVQFINAASIPETAIYNENRVYLKVGDRLISRNVYVLAYDNDLAIIAGNLKNGDRVPVTRIAEVSDGLKVREARDKVEQSGNSVNDVAGAEAFELKTGKVLVK